MNQAVRSVGGGLVASLLSLAYSFSYGALIFAGPLQPFLAQGVASALITAAITAILVAGMSSFRFAVAGPDSNTAAPLSLVMVNLAPSIATMPAADGLALALASLGVATIVTGLALFLLGWKRLGKMIRFVPYPVVAGFLAATGWLMFAGAIKMVSGTSLSIQTLLVLAQPHTLVVLGATVLWAAALWFLTARWKHPIVLPVALVSAVAATHVILAGASLNPTVESALMFSLPGGLHPVVPLLAGDYFRVDWSALVPAAGDMFAVSVLAILTILLNSTSIELATGTEADLDRELRVQGLANIASAAFGGFVGYVSVSRTLVNIAAGGATRLSGMVVGLVALAVLFAGGDVLSYIPRFVLGGLLLQLGARLIWDWGIKSRHVLPLSDWLVVVAIVLLTYSVGFLQALFFGVLAGCVIFAVDVSRIRVIRHQFGLDERSSSLVRSHEENSFIVEHGRQVQVLVLSGYVFFGSANSLLERVKTLTAEGKPSVIIFDFSGVTGIDSSAGASFAKIRTLLMKNGIQQVMVAVSAQSAAILNASAGLGENIRRYDHLDAALEAAEEEVLTTYDAPASLRGSMVDWLTDVIGSREHAQELFGLMTPASCDASSYLCHQGDPTDSLLFIERGPVSVTLDRGTQQALRVRVFGAHTLVGEVGFFLNMPRSANLLAGPNAVIWSLGREAFDQFVTAYPKVGLALARYVIRQLSERLSFSNRQNAALQR
jgi:sulfate permease, SulP family